MTLATESVVNKIYTYVSNKSGFLYYFINVKKEVIVMGPVTTNPWLIALINMTIVFGVLIALGAMMSVLQIIDPTKKKA